MDFYSGLRIHSRTLNLKSILSNKWMVPFCAVKWWYIQFQVWYLNMLNVTPWRWWSYLHHGPGAQTGPDDIGYGLENKTRRDHQSHEDLHSKFKARIQTVTNRSGTHSPTHSLTCQAHSRTCQEHIHEHFRNTFTNMSGTHSLTCQEHIHYCAGTTRWPQ